MRNDAGINGDAQRIEQIAWMLFLKIYDEKENDWEFNEDDYKSFIPENCRWRNWAHDEGDGEALTAEALLDFVDNTLFPTLKALEVTPTTPMRSAIVRATFEDANQYMKDGVLLRQVINVIDELDLSSYEESHAFGEIYETILKEMQSAGTAGEFYTPRAQYSRRPRKVFSVNLWYREEAIPLYALRHQYASPQYRVARGESWQFPYQRCTQLYR